MTSLIALIIALTFGTANVNFQDVQTTDQIQMSKDDGIGVNGDGGQKTEYPDPNTRG